MALGGFEGAEDWPVSTPGAGLVKSDEVELSEGGGTDRTAGGWASEDRDCEFKAGGGAEEAGIVVAGTFDTF
jgi:hypothetical protein